jgi:hypothetical protein
VNRHFSTPYLLQNRSFNIKERSYKGWIKAVKDTDKTYINILMKKGQGCKESCRRQMMGKEYERKDENKSTKGIKKQGTQDIILSWPLHQS